MLVCFLYNTVGHAEAVELPYIVNYQRSLRMGNTGSVVRQSRTVEIYSFCREAHCQSFLDESAIQYSEMAARSLAVPLVQRTHGHVCRLTRHPQLPSCAISQYWIM